MRIYTKVQDGQRLRVVKEILSNGKVYVVADVESASSETFFKTMANIAFERREASLQDGLVSQSDPI
ncbi:hypothetical protein GO013_07355 [Pseudodesulfovibrio sp. JC047]|uniref:hypothetical protein n=1 Tax=Pseudodesulfovibrio sp. JC047 TaxID=2683199 RepID=UPI0013D578D2|nr:hypothetical protein [Pseudodesulfovibrio sp. JC047]NDV19235.1 hypothetical protein [Pseudodesulfovibrio sp. JC047]